MQDEKKASAWPFLEVDASFTYDQEEIIIEINVTNQGTGPAIIDSTELYIGNKSIPIISYY